MSAQSFTPEPTPGPWSLWGSANPSQVIASAWGFIAQTVGGNDVANAHLIAAAPDLYAVAEYMQDLLLRYEINHVSGEAISDAALEIVRAAIAKARGEVK